MVAELLEPHDELSAATCGSSPFATLILTFVTGGRLTSTVDVVLVGAFFLGVFVLQLAVLLFVGEDDNLLLMHADAGVAGALDKVRISVSIVASLPVAFVVAER